MIHRYLIAASLLTFPVFGGSFSFTAVTTGQPTFNRPIQNGGAAPVSLSALGTSVAYSAQTLSISAGGSYSFSSTGVTPSNWDNYLILYSGTFNPLNPLNNAIIANDDNPFVGIAGFTTTLTAGTYVLVTTGYTNGSVGTANNTVNGPGTITGTPEPLTMTMIGLGLLAMGSAKVKKMQAV